VLRQRQQPLDRPGSQATTELRCHMAAAAAGIAPRVIQAAVDGSWLLMDFIDALPWSDEQLCSPHGVEQLGVRLQALHRLPPPKAVPRFDAGRIAAGYLQQLAAQDPGLAAQMQPVADKVDALSQSIDAMALGAVITHGDLQPGNMLGPEPMLVDWEYSQLVDPTYDIACLLTYSPGLAPELPRLLRSAGLPPAAELPVLELQLERFACLNRLWSTVHEPKAG
jgi:aminoglycoside phosphotransferase (APT) family kinase protein